MNRPVHIRTDESADTFWSRVRPSDDYSQDFRVVPQHERIRRRTPFAHQNRPYNLPFTKPWPAKLPMLSSHSVERITLRKVVHDAEEKDNVVRVNHDESSAPHIKRLTSCRSVERAVMQKATCEQEEKETCAQKLMQENEVLKRRIAHLEKSLARSLRINDS